MKKIYIKDIVKATNGILINGNNDFECVNYCKDTRAISKDDIYIGIKGEKFDGNIFWKDALDNGASTVIVQDVEISGEDVEKYKNKNIIKVKDTLDALGKIAEYKRMTYGEDFPVVGVTGSVGKTSTKDIIANVMAQKFNTLKTKGNNNNNIGLPLTLLKLEEHEAAVIEMGMNHFDEIRELSKITKPKISVITNIGTSHIGNLGSRENILKAKLEILEGMDEKNLVINNDNDLLHEFKDKNVNIYTYGIENKSDAMAEDINLMDNCSEFTCNLFGEKFKVTVPVGGIHFIYNSLCAAVIGHYFGLTNEQIKRGIETFELTKKRMDIIKLDNDINIINDSYNASFESMQASLKYLNNLKCKRKIAVLGDMFELGDYSKELHSKVGEEVVKNQIDILICAGENAKYIVEEAKKKGMKNDCIFYFENAEEIEKFIPKIWENGDAILFKASNGMKFFNIVENIIK